MCVCDFCVRLCVVCVCVDVTVEINRKQRERTEAQHLACPGDTLKVLIRFGKASGSRSVVFSFSLNPFRSLVVLLLSLILTRDGIKMHPVR